MEQDKKLHFWAAFNLSVWGAIMTLLMSAYTDLAPVLSGLVGSLVAGVLKEAYDWVSNMMRLRRGLPPKHTVDPMDIWWSWVGSFSGGGAMTLLIL